MDKEQQYLQMIADLEMKLSGRDTRIAELEAKVAEQGEVISKRDARIAELEVAVASLERAIKKLQRRSFGHSSEKMPEPDNMPMLPFEEFKDDTEVQVGNGDAVAPADVVTTVEKESAERRERERAKKNENQRKRRGTIRVPKDMERRVTTIYPENYNAETMIVIGQDVTETLEIDTTYYVKRVVRVKCVSKEDKNTTTGLIYQSPVEPRIAERSFLGDSIIVDILTNKFCHHTPEYRQAKIFKEHGLDIPTSTINRQVHNAIGLLSPIYFAQMKEVVMSDYVHMDESTVRVNDRKGKTRTGYIWSMVDGRPGSSGMYFYYRDGSRGREVMNLMLQGFKGAVQTDGYKVYDALDGKPNFRQLNCMAHARRKFEAIKDDYPDDVPKILKSFAYLYQIEANLKERGASVEEIKKEREEKSIPILQCMKRWMDQKYRETTPKSGLGEALAYSLVRWDKLCAYTTDGRYNIDNNPVERSMRPIALGRKNWLFINSDESGEDFAIIATLIRTCEMLGINPREWLTHTFSKIVGKKDYDAVALLPCNYVKE